MKKIGVEKNMHIKDVPQIIKQLLEKDEVIMASCFVKNSGASASRILIGVTAGIGITFNDYADHFRVVATNKRILLVGIADTVDLVTGVRVIDYNEIKKLKMSKKMNHINIILNDGKFFELTSIDFTDDNSMLERSIATFNYIASNLNEKNVEIKSNILNSEIIVLVAITILPFIISFIIIMGLL